VTPPADVRRGGFDEFAEYVNPRIVRRARLTGEPFRIVRAQDGRLFDESGRAYEDFHGVQALGHRHPAVTAAVSAYLESDLPSWYPSRIHPHAGRLARTLCERTGYTNAYFTCSGSEAVEAALKLARAATRRPRLLCLEGAYHGCGVGSTALMAEGPFRDPFGPHLPGVTALPFGDVHALASAFGQGDVGAVVVEPIQGEAGVRALPGEYVDALCELSAAHGALLVADEVQTGLGRSGRFLMSEAWPRRPDAVVLAKALGGGLVPISVMLTRREWFERAYGGDIEDGEAHNTTWGQNAVGMAAALATLDLVTADLIERIRQAGDRLQRDLAAALGSCPLFVEVRGAGLMLGLALRPPDHPWLSLEHFGFPELAEKGRTVVAPLLCHRLARRGFFTLPCAHDWSVVRVQPRFFVDDETLAAFVRACREELDHLAALS